MRLRAAVGEEDEVADGDLLLGGALEELLQAVAQARPGRDDVAHEERRGLREVDLLVRVLGDMPLLGVLRVARALGRHEARRVRVPAEGVGERVAQAEVEAAAEDVHDDGVGFGDVGRERSEDLRAGLAQEPRVADAGDGRIVADRAGAGRRGDVGLQSARLGRADAVQAGGAGFVGEGKGFGGHGGAREGDGGRRTATKESLADASRRVHPFRSLAEFVEEVRDQIPPHRRIVCQSLRR